MLLIVSSRELTMLTKSLSSSQVVRWEFVSSGGTSSWRININKTWTDHTNTHLCASHTHTHTRTHPQTTEGVVFSPSGQTLLFHGALLRYRRPPCRTPLRLRPPAPPPSPTRPHLRSPTPPNLAGKKHLDTPEADCWSLIPSNVRTVESLVIFFFSTKDSRLSSSDFTSTPQSMTPPKTKQKVHSLVCSYVSTQITAPTLKVSLITSSYDDQMRAWRLFLFLYFTLCGDMLWFLSFDICTHCKSLWRETFPSWH